jgi:hypothetical protein
LLFTVTLFGPGECIWNDPSNRPPPLLVRMRVDSVVPSGNAVRIAVAFVLLAFTSSSPPLPPTNLNCALWIVTTSGGGGAAVVTVKIAVALPCVPQHAVAETVTLTFAPTRDVVTGK